MGQALAKKKTGKARQAGRKREVPAVTLPQGNFGPDTTKGSRQMQNAEIIPLHQRGGDWQIKIRRHPLEWLARGSGKNRTARITPRQRNAGLMFFAKWEATQLTGEAVFSRPYVDDSQKGDPMIRRVEAETEFKRLVRAIPPDCRDLVINVVCRHGAVTQEWVIGDHRLDEWLCKLRRGLDGVADEFGI